MELKNRRELIQLVNELDFKVGAEVGVSFGYFSKHILENTNMVLYSIDPWEKNIELGNPEQAYESTQQILKQFGEKSIIIKGYSPEVCDKFQDNSVDFVYIDGLHTYEAVKADLDGWYSKVKTNGIIAGHDYSIKDWIGVVMAVSDFVSKNNLELFLTGTAEGINDGNQEFDGNQPSWWFYKK